MLIYQVGCWIYTVDGHEETYKVCEETVKYNIVKAPKRLKFKKLSKTL